MPDAAEVERNGRLAVLLVEMDVGDPGRRLEIAEPDDDRDGHAVDRGQLEAAGPWPARRGGLDDRVGRRDRAEQHVHAIFAVGQALRRPRGDADRLRLVRRQSDPARRVDDHVGRGLVRGGRLGDVDQAAVLGHPAELDRDAIGRRLLADIVEDDLGALAAVEHDPRRSDEQVADAGLGGRRSGEERRGDSSRARMDWVQQFIMAIPTLLRSGAIASSLVRNGLFSVNHDR